MIIIKLEGKIVNIYKDDGDSPIYQIRKSELPVSREESGHNISEWIDQLMTKTWIEDNSLYELATLINREFPENDINWGVTFFPVEKRRYLDHVEATKRITSDIKKSEVEKLFESIQTGIDESNEFVNGKVTEIVENNLQKYGLNKS